MKVELEERELWPTRAHITDAGLDLKAKEAKIIKIGQTEKIGTGVKMEIPTGYVGLLMPRSGAPYSLANTVGVIDSDYRGEIIAKVINDTENIMSIKKHEKFVQLIIVPCITPEITIAKKVSETKRADKGFGSSGE